MTASRQELKSYFANGKLPTGENFAELIDSMTQQDEFKAHEEAFEKWTNRGEVSLGAGDLAWRLFVDSAHHIRLQPGPKYDAKAGAADVQLTGWVGMAGRIGETIDSDAFSAEQTELDVSALPSIDSDGKWQKIVDMPGHPCVFEITAATAQPPLKPQSRIKSALSWLVGRSPRGNAIVHAVVTANGSHHEPSLTTTGQPDATNTWQRLKRNLLGLVLLLLILAQFNDLWPFGGDLLADTRSLATVLTPRFVAGVILALYFLYVARLVSLHLSTRRNAVALRWTKSTGSVIAGNAEYTLEMRGPPIDEGRAPGKVFYHITKLWN